MNQYLDHSRIILSDPRSGYKPNRTGVDSISLFGYQNEYDLSKGFPLMTTKKMAFNALVHELVWFLSGSSNIKYLVDNGVHIWDGNAFQHYLNQQGRGKQLKMYSPEWVEEMNRYISHIKEDPEFAKAHGDLGPVYGKQWRHWKTDDGREIDQIADALKLLKNSPASRRNIVTAWNPGEVSYMALPPCHTFFHLNVLNGKLDCQLYQRSCDMFLGVPFNVASYALLTQILAQQAGLEPGRFIHSFGDSHFYCGTHERGNWYGNNLSELKPLFSRPSIALDHILSNAPPERAETKGQDHVTAILEQLAREPKPLPHVEITPGKSLDDLVFSDFSLKNYNPHPPINRKMAV